MSRSMTRRRFTSVLAGCAVAGRYAFAARAGRTRPNILFITADDLQYDSLQVTGCTIPGITPNLNALAAQSLRFENAHVTISVCQPSRSVLMTGRYPHRNGARGFQPIDAGVPTLQEQLRAAGYRNGIMGKVGHLAPQEKFCWDTVVQAGDLGTGRSPELYHTHAKAFFTKAKESGTPFFLMANAHDPHRPFAGSAQEAEGARRGGAQQYPAPRRLVRAEEVRVPGFLPDIPEVRREVAEYYSSVNRGDESVGAILRALQESALEADTLVMFLSDNGMAFPFAKTNCWRASTHTPWMVRWPGTVKPGAIDREHFISGIDFMPTILEAAGLPQVAGMDGHSFLPLFRGDRQQGRETVFTCLHRTSGNNDYPMVAIQDRRFGYIFNPWSDGRTVFKNESQSGRTFKAMQQAAKTDPAIAARVTHFLYRTKEELYDYETDPDALRNLAGDPAHHSVLARLRNVLLDVMNATQDPSLAAFKKHIDA